jgi:FlaA1/EpsC-like NDP-sugar epimerase
MSPEVRRVALLRLAKLFDLTAVSLTFVIALAIGSGAASWPTLANVFAMRIEISNILIFGVYIAVCASIFSACGLYRSHRFSSSIRRAREVLLAVSLISVIIFILRVPLALSFASNKFLLIFWLLLLVFLVSAHELAQQLLFYARSRGQNLRNIVIVGERREATDLAARLENDSNFGYRVLDIIVPGGSQK